MVSFVKANELAMMTTALVALVTVDASGTRHRGAVPVCGSGRNNFQANLVSGSAATSNRNGAGPMLGK